jgi:hypothetical protein
MSKIKLVVDDLKVDSFSTSGTQGRNGTVQGFMPPPTLYTCPEAGCESAGCPTDGCTTDTNVDTCAASCQGGCYLSADGGNDFTCALDCFSHYTDCHRCP